MQSGDENIRKHPRGTAVRAREQLKEWTDILRRPREDVENDND